MIPFPHIWRTDPATGQLRCFARRQDSEPANVGEAIAGRARHAVAHHAVAGVMVAAAQMRLHGYGEIEANGTAELLRRMAAAIADCQEVVASLEDGLNEVIGTWPDGVPADYTAAKAKASRDA